MRCYVHQDQEAVGVCRGCQKGLCPVCAVDHGYAISCKGACEAKVAVQERLTLRASTLTDTQRRFRYVYAVFILIMGLAFAGWGVWYGQPWNFSTLLGAVFIVYGLVALRASMRWAREMKAVHAE